MAAPYARASEDCSRRNGQPKSVPGSTNEAQQRSRRDVPLVVEHPELAGEDERRQPGDEDAARGHSHRRRRAAAAAQQQHRHARADPTARDRRTDPISSACANDAILPRPQAGQHPQQRRDSLGRMAVDERAVREPDRHGQQPDGEPHPVADAHPAEHEQRAAPRRRSPARTPARQDSEPPRRPRAAAGPTAGSGPRRCRPSRTDSSASPRWTK